MFDSRQLLNIVLLLLLPATFAMGQTTQWRLLWDDPNDPDSVTIDHYNVYRNTANNSSGAVMIAQPTEAEFINRVGQSATNITAGVTYYYWVTAVDDNSLESDFSENAHAAIPKITMASPILYLGLNQSDTLSLNDSVAYGIYDLSLLVWKIDSTDQITKGEVTATLADESTLIFASTENFKTEASFTISVEDTNEFYDIFELTIRPRVAPVFTPPVDTLSFDANDSYQINLNEFVVSPLFDTDSLTWSVQDTTHLIVEWTNDSTAVIRAKEAWAGTERLRFTVSDPNGLSTSGDIVFRVFSVLSLQVNHFPPVSDEDESFTILLNASLLANPANNTYPADSLYWWYGGNNHISIPGVDEVNELRRLDCVPGQDWYGQEAFQLFARDPSGNSGTINVFCTIRAVNDAPVVTIPNQFFKSGTDTVTLNLDDYVEDVDDPDNLIAWPPVTGSENLTISIDNTNRIATVTLPDTNWIGIETVTFTATDTSDLSGTDNVSFYSVPPDTFILEEAITRTVAEGQDFPPVHLDEFLIYSAFQEDSITWIPPTDGILGVEINMENRLASITIPDTNWFGEEDILFAAQDFAGKTAQTSVTFIVTPVNDPPRFLLSIPDQAIDQGGAFTDFQLDTFVTDIDDELSALSWTASGNANLDVDIGETHIASITLNNEDWAGSETITFTVTDTSGLSRSDEAVFTINIILPDSIILSPIERSVIQEGEDFPPLPLNDYVSSAPVPNDSIAWNFRGNTDLLISIDSITHVASVHTPDEDWYGEERVTFVAQEPGGDTAQVVTTFEVSAVNDPPSFSEEFPNSQTININGVFSPINLAAYVSDVDNSLTELTWPDPDNGRYISAKVTSTGIAVMTIEDPGFYGTDTVTFIVQDAGGATDEQPVVLKVNNTDSSNFSDILSSPMGSATVYVVQCQTQFPAISYVRYGKDLMDSFTSRSSEYKIEHVHVLDHLKPNTTYHFQTVAIDTNDDAHYSLQGTFTTGSEEGEVNVFPNPYKAGEKQIDDVIHFTNLPENSSVQIFNLLGEPVFRENEVSHYFHWRMVNNSDNKIQSGIYIYIIKDQGNKKVTSGKLVIIR